MMQMELPITDRQPVKDMTLLQFQCTNCDSELVHKIAQLLIPGLATANIDSVTGDPFRSPSQVVVDLRKEMVDYLTERSQNFITESILGPKGSNGSVLTQQEVVEMSDDPAEIISDFMDDFAELKRNLFSRVSGWLLSESREDKIDNFGQEMEMNNFWL
ncbi:hypothetical protein LUZ60_013422 [Juncus effusus]|nr:hypothetical protein LUZ60_013422 [Juncus effusus]